MLGALEQLKQRAVDEDAEAAGEREQAEARADEELETARRDTHEKFMRAALSRLLNVVRRE